MKDNRVNKLTLGNILLLFFMFTMLACLNPGSDNDDKGDLSVYVAGHYVDDSQKACYWNGKVRTTLHPIGSSSSCAYSITVVDSVVYVAGYYYDSGTQKACYWKNGVRTDLTAPGNGYSYTRAIAVGN